MRQKTPDLGAGVRRARFTSEMMYGGKEIHPSNQTHWRMDLYVNRQTREKLEEIRSKPGIRANEYMQELLRPRVKADSDSMKECLEEPLEKLRLDLQDLRVSDPSGLKMRQFVQDMSALLKQSDPSDSSTQSEAKYLLERFLGTTVDKLISEFEEEVQSELDKLSDG